MIRSILILTAFVAVGSAHAYDLKQVAKAELDAKECRVRLLDGNRLAELLTLRRCTLLEELAREKRKAYEVRQRKEHERFSEDARG
jgi:hypothetical protein